MNLQTIINEELQVIISESYFLNEAVSLDEKRRTLDQLKGIQKALYKTKMALLGLGEMMKKPIERRVTYDAADEITSSLSKITSVIIMADDHVKRLTARAFQTPSFNDTQATQA